MKEKVLKKLGAGLLAIMMMISVMPTTAVHAATNEIWVNGENIITAADNTVQCGNGTATYDPSTDTLTLTNAVINSGGPSTGPLYGINVGIRASGNLNVVLVGNNVIGAGADTALGGGIMTDGTLNISGTGKLAINTSRSVQPATTHSAIEAIGAVSIQNATLDIKDWASTRFFNGVYFVDHGIRTESTITLSAVTFNGANLDSLADTLDGNITVTDSKIEITNSLQAINTCGIVTITNSSLEGSVTTAGVPENEFYNDTGIVGSSVIVDNSTINLNTNKSNAIFADDTITLKNGTSITAKSEWPTLYSDNIVGISDSTVNLESRTGNGIYAGSTLTVDQNAFITAKGYNPALFSGSMMEITDSSVKAEATADYGIWSRGSLAIKGDSDIVAAGVGGSIGASTTATVTPATEKKVEILAGDDKDSAMAVENSPFAVETDISTYRNKAYFHSKTYDKYTVTVNNGTGSDDYAEGETVTITADTPASGKQFKDWTVVSGSVTLANPASAATTFAMPASTVEVTANYEDIPETKYNVTVNGGTTDKTEYAEGETVTINADTPASGKQFKDWTVVSGSVTLANPTSASTTFTMPANDVEVTANYDDVPPIPAKPTITAGTGSSHQKGSGKDMTFICSGTLEDLINIYIDDKLVNSQNYTLQSGSTILTLKANYLDTLSTGKHTLKFQYKDNLSATTEFTVVEKGTTPPTEDKKPDTPVKKTTVPETGDTTNMMLLFSLLVLSGGAIGFVSCKKKRRCN